TNQDLPHQMEGTLRGRKYVVDLSLEPGESIEVMIEPVVESKELDTQVSVADRVSDRADNDRDVPPRSLKTDFVEIGWESPSGINKWIDAKTGRDLIASDAGHPPFTL